MVNSHLIVQVFHRKGKRLDTYEMNQLQRAEISASRSCAHVGDYPRLSRFLLLFTTSQFNGMTRMLYSRHPQIKAPPGYGIRTIWSVTHERLHQLCKRENMHSGWSFFVGNGHDAGRTCTTSSTIGWCGELRTIRSM